MPRTDDTTQSDTRAIVYPYCGHRDDDTYSVIEVLRGDEDDEAECECGECDKTFTVTMTTEVTFHTHRVTQEEDGEGPKDSAPSLVSSPPSDAMDRAWQGVMDSPYVKSAIASVEDTARARLVNANAIFFSWGVIIPLPMDAASLMRATDAARALGFNLISQRIAERVEPLFGPVLAVTQNGGLEDAWLDFLRERERAKR